MASPGGKNIGSNCLQRTQLAQRKFIAIRTNKRRYPKSNLPILFGIFYFVKKAF